MLRLLEKCSPFLKGSALPSGHIQYKILCIAQSVKSFQFCSQNSTALFPSYSWNKLNYAKQMTHDKWFILPAKQISWANLVILISSNLVTKLALFPLINNWIDLINIGIFKSSVHGSKNITKKNNEYLGLHEKIAIVWILNSLKA